MARLNEAPVPAESIDAVKRRFLRQNRELAKTNSNQSIRIRNLEAESSRLLAENLSLREQVIQLQAELESYQGYPTRQTIGTVKDQLEAKIQELGTLVAELGTLSNRPPRCKPQALAVKRSPDERNWKNTLLLSEVTGGEGLLPTIREDKYFSRRTMDSEEIREMIGNQVGESPELGPPPIAHFQDEDPIKFDARSSGLDGSSGDARDGGDGLPAEMSVNLETRKKRRDSSNVRRMSIFHSPPDTTDDSTKGDPIKPLKAGAKRKLSTREEDAYNDASTSLPAEEFRFNRKTTGNADLKTQAQPILAAPGRKVLGNKSVNTDPVGSPKKSSKSAVLDSKPDLKKDAPPVLKTTSRSRFTARKAPPPTTVEIPSAPSNEILETVEVPLESLSLPPTTPATLDTVSPVSTEPSAARAESKDTPPPGDLNPSSVLNDSQPGGRAARRARASVNYAEPNLISKMRRPTKELVDAVVKTDRRSLSLKPEEEPISAPATTEKKMRTVVIKRERTDEMASAWKSLPSASQQEEPNSPLSKKTSKLKAVKTEPKDSTAENAKVSTTSADISARTGDAASNRKRLSSKVTSNVQTDSEERATADEDNLAIFDFNESSPAHPSNRDMAKANRVDLGKPSRTSSRRHSSISSLTSSANPSTINSSASRSIGPSNAEATKGELTAAPEAVGAKSERAAARRRSMLL